MVSEERLRALDAGGGEHDMEDQLDTLSSEAPSLLWREGFVKMPGRARKFFGIPLECNGHIVAVEAGDGHAAGGGVLPSS